MTHLDRLQLVDALDGAAPDVDAHLHACAACREQLDDLRAALASVRADAVPEPSPLFWNHFASRVNARIHTAATATPPSTEGGWLPHALACSGVLALVLAVVSIIVAPKRPAHAPGIGVEQTSAVAESDPAPDDAWTVIQALASDVDYEEARAAGAAPGEGSVDRAALELTDNERAELARLIDAELKRMEP